MQVLALVVLLQCILPSMNNCTCHSNESPTLGREYIAYHSAWLNLMWILL